MRSIAQKISRRLLKPLTYLIRRDSSFSKPYLYLLRLFIRKFRGRSIVVFRMLSCNEEDVLFELHQECQVGSYSPQKSGEADRSSCALLDCPAVKVYSLKNQVIHINGSYMLDSDRATVWADIYPIYQKGRYSAGILKEHGMRMALVDVGDETRTIEAGVFLGGNGSFNYYHFLVEIIPKLEALRQIKDQLPNIPLLLNDCIEEIDTFSQILDVYAPEFERLFLKQGECYKVEELMGVSSGAYLPFNLSKGSYFTSSDFITRPESISYLRRQAFECLGSRGPNGFRRVFLARKQARRNYNQDEIFKALEPLGFVVLFPEEYSFIDQVKLFNEADFIVGATGAGWTNLLYAKPGCKALCWMAEGLGDFAAFSTLAGLVEVELQYHIYASTAETTASLYSQDYVIDHELIVETVSLMIAA